MAVKTVCPSCRKSFTAPEGSLGKKVDCPLCGHRTLLRTAEELRELEFVQIERQKQLDEDRKKIELIERMSLRQRRGTQPYYETFGTGRGEAVRHFHPSAPSRYLRVRALGDVFLLFAYLELGLVFMGIGLTIYLGIAGVIPSVALVTLAVIGWSIVGSVLFLGLKLVGELALLFSDVGDQQRDVVDLLLDVRENTDEPARET